MLNSLAWALVGGLLLGAPTRAGTTMPQMPAPAIEKIARARAAAASKVRLMEASPKCDRDVVTDIV